jgi:transcription initiation factor TFIIH subunit 1
MQLVQLDGAAYVFHFAGVDPKSDRAKISELLLQMTKTAQVANPELEAKYKLLQDPGLYALYKDMVVSGIITAEEFWANRCDNTSLSNDQQSGLPSSFLGDIQAVSGCNSVQYQLSTEMIENIFRTYPSVKMKHSQLVPDKLSEEQFWVQFFQSHKFHRNRLPHQSSASSSSLFQDCLEQDIENIKLSSSADTNLLRSLDNPFEDTEDSSKVTSTSKQLVQRCNQHSALILHAINPNNSNVSLVSDPNATQNESSLTLQLSSFGSHDVVSSAPLVSLAREYLSSNDYTQEHKMMSSSYQGQLACRHLLPGGSLMGGGSSGASVSSSAIEGLHRHQRSLGEILRHFWACFPVLNTQLEQKAHRMAQCLQDYKDKQLSEFSSQLLPTEVDLMVPLYQMIERAQSKYIDWSTKHSKH